MPGADAPCAPWVTANAVRNCKPCDSIGDADTAYEQAAQVASNWLYRLTGRRYCGECTETVRPVPRCVWPGWTPYRRISNLNFYDWFDSRRGTFGPAQYGPRGEGAFEVTLGQAVIREVQTVKVDGQVLSPAAYRVDDARYLVRVDGEPWPAVNDFTKDDTAEGTWSVTFTYGEDPPADGILAAQVLACEWVLAFRNDDKCRLPRGVQNLTRQGVNIALVDVASALKDGLTGIAEVDAFVLSSNPHRLAQRGTVVLPDMPRAVRRAGTFPGS